MASTPAGCTFPSRRSRLRRRARQPEPTVAVASSTVVDSLSWSSKIPKIPTSTRRFAPPTASVAATADPTVITVLSERERQTQLKILLDTSCLRRRLLHVSLAHLYEMIDSSIGFTAANQRLVS